MIELNRFFLSEVYWYRSVILPDELMAMQRVFGTKKDMIDGVIIFFLFRMKFI